MLIKYCCSGLLLLVAGRPLQAGVLDDLAKPQEGRSMRSTSTMRVGEVRRAGEEKLNPKGPDDRKEEEEEEKFLKGEGTNDHQTEHHHH